MASGDIRNHAVEAHENSGLTSRLILTYVEREGGPEAVQALLQRAGLTDYEQQLRDESFWFSFEAKIALLEAAAEVLLDPQVAWHIGAAAVELNAFQMLKIILRTVGGPQLVYSAIGRTGQKFSWTHSVEVLASQPSFARLRYRDISGVGYHELDCQYSQGLLSSVPTMFGALPARVHHPECALRGGDACVYELRWSEQSSATLLRRAKVWGALSSGAVLASLAYGRRARPLAVSVPAMGGALLAREALRQNAQNIQSLKTLARDQRALGERLFASLRDLVGELRVEEVLDKIVENAQATLGSREFALLVATDAGLRCRSNTPALTPATVQTIEEWANSVPGSLESPVDHPALEAVPALASLAADHSTPLGALYSSPLRFREGTMGALVGLAHGTDRFDAVEVDVLRAYADQCAIALANARLFARVEDMARRDSLTGLLNSREFESEVARRIRHAERVDGTVAIVMLDLDGFKLVNDELGHAEGDKLLRRVAEVIETVSFTEGTAHRVGGDEFALVLPGASKSDAEAVARGIQGRIDAFHQPVTVSWGVAMWPHDGPSQNFLVFNADRALYEHKARHGKIDRRLTLVSDEQEQNSARLAALTAIDPHDHYVRTLATTLARAVDAKDSYTRSHSETVSELCELIARQLGFDEDRVARAALAGLLHDVGKIGVPDSILKKPSSLTDEEFAIMQSHSTLGHKIVNGAGLTETASWILHHHERIDGRGYPDGLAGEEIPQESRIILVADAFEAIISDRPYRAGRPVAAALAEIERHSGTQFDPRCVQALRRVLGSGAREFFSSPQAEARRAAGA